MMFRQCFFVISAFLFATSTILAGQDAPSHSKYAPLPEQAQKLIQLAGNTTDDADRLLYLKMLFARGDLDSPILDDLKKLIPVAESWVNTQREDEAILVRAHQIGVDVRRTTGSYLWRYFAMNPKKVDRFLAHLSEDSPLFPVECIYEAKVRIWETIEMGGLIGVPALRDQWFGRAKYCLERAHEAFPDNRIIRMYLGEPIPWPTTYEPCPDAPEWANLQRESLEALTDIIHWWIDHRQIADGQYGGGWNDDCEMWRDWKPILIGFDDPKVVNAQKRFSESLMAQPHMRGGYTSKMSDIEHTSEDSVDAILPMMHLDPDNPDWYQHISRIMDLMKNQWTGRNERGFLQFKSTWFTSDKIDMRPYYCCDTVYHSRVVEPACTWWIRDPKMPYADLLIDWMDTWVDAARRSERGKPAGIIPSAIHWPEGFVGGLGEHWWEPKNYEEFLYNWPSDMSGMTDSLLVTWYRTRNDKYLEPIHFLAHLYREHLNHRVSNPKAGTLEWCGLRSGCVMGTLAKYRLLSGDTQYDDLIAKSASYTNLLLTGERSSVVKQLRSTAAVLRTDFEGYTREVRFTDRVFSQARWYDTMHIAGPKHNPSCSILFETVSGEPSHFMTFPMNAVRWHTSSRNIAALVTKTSPKAFSAELFHFGDSVRPVDAELLLLEPGQYELIFETKNADGSNKQTQQQIRIENSHRRVHLDLPPKTLCTVSIQ